MTLPPVDTNNKVIAGVCSGLANHWETDVLAIRLGTILCAVMTAAVPVILAYLILAIIMPKS